MGKLKRYVKISLCMLLSAAMVCADVGISVSAMEWTSAAEEETAENYEENATDALNVGSEDQTEENMTTESAAEEVTEETETEKNTITEESEAQNTTSEEANEEKSQEESITDKGDAEETTPESSSADESTTEEMKTEEYGAETIETEEITEEETAVEETEESIQKLAFSDDDIAHNVYNDITWVIDKDGKLTVTGTGDFAPEDQRNSTSRAPWYENRAEIKSAVVNVTGMTNARAMFNDCTNLVEVDLSGFETNQVTDMNDMFQNCSSLTSLDVSGFDTSQVTDMAGMFSGCSSLTELDVAKFDTSQVTEIIFMFNGCSSLTNLDVSHFDTGNVLRMSRMFQGCSGLTSLNVGNFNTGKVTAMGGMFDGCNLLTGLDVSHFDTSHVTSIDYMFSDCSSLTSLDVSNFDTSQITNMSGMFRNCSELTNLNVANFKTGKVTNMWQMFAGCNKLTSLDVSGFNTGQVTNMRSMFYGCSDLTSLDVSRFDTSQVTSMYWMFHSCSNLTSLDVSHFDTSKVTDMRWMFGSCSNLTSLDVSHFDTSKVADMSWMFELCSNLTSLDVSRFDTSQVTSMNSMFSGCSNLTSLDVNGFDTSQVPDMSGMFNRCSNLTSLDVSGFDTSQVTNMRMMFNGCSNLTSLDVSHFDTSKVTDMSYMFNGCSNLASLNVSHFDTSQVTTMSDMFSRCGSLTSLDVSSFDVSNVTETSGMLGFCDVLAALYTPYNLTQSVALPEAAETDGWHDTEGNTYTELPQNLNHSILLVRGSVSPIEAHITAGMPKTVFYCGETVSLDNLNVRYYGSDGTVRKLSASEYTVTPSVVDTSEPGEQILTVTYSGNGDELTATVKLTIEKLKENRASVQISGIMFEARGYNRQPASYSGTVSVQTEDGTDITDKVKEALVCTYSGTQADGSVYADEQAPKNAGSYKLTIAISGDNTDYMGSGEFPFTIAKAPLTITARDMGLVIGAEIPKAEDYKYDISSGQLFEGDSLITDPILSCNIVDTTKEGTYDITVSGADAGMNYEITYKNGTLTVSETGVSTAYYTVTFSLSGKGNDITNSGVREGSLLEKPQDPTAEGYIFTGWYKDAACTVKWDFAIDIIQSDMTLYAGWISDGGAVNSGAAWQISEIAPVSYTGSAIKPGVTVLAPDGTLLKSGKDYIITYKNNINADSKAASGGTGSAENDTAGGFDKELPYIIITGKGNYQKSIYTNFHINPASISDDGETPAAGFTLKYTEQFVTANKAQKPFTSIKYKKAMTMGKDYEVSLAKCMEDGSLQNIPASGAAAPAIAANDTGMFQLTITGKGNYSGTITKEVYVGSRSSLMKNAKIALGRNIKSVKYTGSDIEPKAAAETGEDVFTVKMGSRYLIPGVHYNVSYSNQKAVGTATIIVKGTGEYIGTKTATFKITGTPFKAKDATVNGFEASKTYTGSAIEQGGDGIVIGGKTLVCGTDYTTAYKNNVKKGTATVTFRANPASGYSGSFNKTFKIMAVDLSQISGISFDEYTVTGAGADRKLSGSVVYSKAGAKPSGSFTLKDDNNNTLALGTDYTVNYTNNKKVGAPAVMTIRGKGNYTGKMTVGYTIGQAPLDGNDNLTQSCTPAAYNQNKPDDYLYKPKFKVLDGNKALAAGTDYKALTNDSYKNCTQDKVKAYLAALEDGTVTGEALREMQPYVEITAADNGGYTGSIKVYLTVYKTKLAKNNLKVTITLDTDIYTGKQVRPEVTVTVTADGKTKVLAEGRDYTLTYGTNITAGKNKGTVTVNGTGLYGGSVTTKFTIQSKDVNKR